MALKRSLAALLPLISLFWLTACEMPSTSVDSLVSNGSKDNANNANTAVSRPTLVASASSSFGTVTVSQSSSIVITVANVGGEDATISSLSRTGTVFSISGDTCTSTVLPANQSCSFTLTFTPTSAGNSSTIVTVLYTDSSSSSYSLSTTYSATGIVTTPSLIASSSSAFGTVTVGQTASSMITISNIGTATATIQSIGLVGAAFSKSSDTCTAATLAVGQSCTFTLTFTPASAGSASVTVTTTYLDSQSSAYTLVSNYSGVGQIATPSFAASPSSADFGVISTGSNFSRSIVISNSTSVSAIAGTATISGTDFSITTDGCDGLPIVSGGSTCSITVRFAPTAAVARSGTLTVPYTAAGTTYNLTVALSGSGQTPTPDISINPSSWDFGSVAINGSSSKAILISNASASSSVAIASVTLTGNSDYSVSDNCPATLAASANCTATITFSPTTSGSKVTSLVVSYGASSNKSISIIGTGSTYLSFNGLDSIDQVEGQSMRLNWTAATGGAVSAYRVLRYNGSAYVVHATLSSATLNYTDTGLTPGTSYRYIVNAIDNAGVSDGNTTSRTATTPTSSFDTIATLAIQEGSSGTRALTCSDAIGNSPTFQQISQTDNAGNCLVSGANLQCSPSVKAGHATWTDDVVIRCSIGGVTYDRTATVSVSDLNHAPVLTLPADRTFPSPISQSSAYTMTPSSSDSDGDSPTYTCLVQSVGLLASDPGYVAPNTQCASLPGFQGATASFDSSTGQVVWTPSTTQAGTYDFKVTADDGYGGTDTGHHYATVSPYYDSTGLNFLYHPLFADSKQAPGVTNQVTSWADIGPYGLTATLQGFGATPWSGNGAYNDPYRLVFNGTAGKLQIPTYNYNTRRFYYIFFRLPASAADGIHPLFSFRNVGLFAFEKGGPGPNRFLFLRYDGTTGGNDFGTSAWTYVPGQWKYLRIEADIDWSGTSAGTLAIADPISGAGWNTSWVSSPANAGTDYIGYKPVGVGSTYAAEVDSTVERFSEFEITDISAYLNYTNETLNDGKFWAQYDALAESVRRFKSADIRRTNLGLYYDAAYAQYDMLTTYDPSSQCSGMYWYPLQSQNSVIDINNRWRLRINMNGFSNAGCAAVEGFQGTGLTTDPYRFVFNGLTDYMINSDSAPTTMASYNNQGDQTRPFTESTLENSYEIWFNPDSSGNTGSDAWGSVLNFFNNNTSDTTSKEMVFGVTVKNSGNGTSVPNLYFESSTGGGNLSITTASSAIQNDQWNHLAVTISASGQIKMYRNGHPFYTSSDGALTFNPFASRGGPATGSQGWSFIFGAIWGGFLPGSPSAFKGSISIMRTYRGHALTPAEVLYHCQHEASRFQGVSCAP